MKYWDKTKETADRTMRYADKTKKMTDKAVTMRSDQTEIKIKWLYTVSKISDFK